MSDYNLTKPQKKFRTWLNNNAPVYEVEALKAGFTQTTINAVVAKGLVRRSNGQFVLA